MVENEPDVKKWNISPRYVVQVRAKEFEYHPPHFHVIGNEFEAVFKLSNGELYKYGRKKWTAQMVSEVQKWYQIHQDELKNAWTLLHGS